VSLDPKDTRSVFERARHTASIVGSLSHEGYVPTREAEAVHQCVARGEITSEEAIAISRERGLEREPSGARRYRQR
jgi:Antitoxin VbhA